MSYRRRLLSIKRNKVSVQVSREAKKLLIEYGFDDVSNLPFPIKGTGAKGNITKKDVVNWLANLPSPINPEEEE